MRCYQLSAFEHQKNILPVKCHVILGEVLVKAIYNWRFPIF